MCDCKIKDNCCSFNKSFEDNSFAREKLDAYRRLSLAYEMMVLLLRLRG